MFDKISRRYLSVLVAVVMVLTIVPAAAAGGIQDEGDLLGKDSDVIVGNDNYDFVNAASMGAAVNEPIVNDFEGYVPVSSVDDLAKVGKGVETLSDFDGNTYSWLLSDKYYLTQDIIFDPNNPEHDTNDGVEIGISVTVSGTDLSIYLTPVRGDVSSLYAWFGTSYSEAANDTVTLTDISQGTYTLVIGGMLDSGEPFAFSADIDTTISGEKVNETFNSNGNFNPIGTLNIPFTGTFDGNRHVISGMYVAIGTQHADSYVGLFSYTEGACISDLGNMGGSVTVTATVNLSVKAYAYAGGIAGYSSSSSITNCYNAGSVVATSTVTTVGVYAYAGAYAGGIAGYSSSSSITNCYNAGSVVATATTTNINFSAQSSTGGIVGINGYSQITNCYNTGSVTATGIDAFTGGIAGSMHNSQITNCYNAGSVTATATTDAYAYAYAYAGGIAGSLSSLSSLSSSITDCYNTGPVTAMAMATNPCAYAGGTVGLLSHFSSSIITNCYNVGSVVATASGVAYAGGIVGFSGASSLSITNCYFIEGQITVNGHSADTVCGSLLYDSVFLVDGDSSICRDDCQRSGAKSAEDMKPSIGNAKNGISVYYTGKTTVGSEEIPGWDFESIWAINPKVNNGFPTLRSEDKNLLEVTASKNGNMAVLDCIADESSSARWYSVLVQFSDGSFQRSVGSLSFNNSKAEFNVYLGGNSEPVSYLVFISDERPIFGGEYITPAMEAGGF